MSIKTSLHEIYLEASHFFKKVYPEFVTSKRPDKLQGIPVFIFHTIRPKIFEEELEFLKENNYVTIGADELYNYITGKAGLSEKAILLTFDDGRKSVYTYGFPLLKKYDFRATVFIIPGHTKDNPPTSPFSKGGQRGIIVKEGEGRFEIEDGSDPHDKEILSWQEIKIMKDSGLIDFGSHTLYHNKIFTGPEIVDFLGPDYNMRPYDYPAVPEGLENVLFEREPSSFYGMPIYTNDSPMSGKQRFIDDSGLRDECMKYFRERFGNPPSSPFSKGGQRGIIVKGGEGGLWKKELFRFSADYRRRNNLPVRFSATDNTEKDIYDNLYTSKRIIEEKLGEKVNHLCYPFGIWSELSTEMAKKAGYLSAFCAYIPGRSINKSGDDRYKIVRLKDDYIFRLPGKGRKSLAEIFLHKFKRRLKRESVY